MSKHSRRTITLTLTETWTITWEAAGYAQSQTQTSVSQLSKESNMYAHWGTFPKGHPFRDVLPVAESAMAQYGLQIYSQAFHDKYIVTGGNANVMVIVTCIPEGEQSWVVVYAAAPDSAVAEHARNAIRETIVKAVFFD
ncbi:MAG: hypothetical protein U0350_46125 [Caldilineaceae bacterium]